MHYSLFNQCRKKHDGMLPLISVNTFLSASSAGDHGGEIVTESGLIGSAEEEKGQQIANEKRYGEACNALASDSLKVLQQTARDRRNVFEQLIEAVKYNSLRQISHALYDMGGEYRRNMWRANEAVFHDPSLIFKRDGPICFVLGPMIDL